MKKATVEQAKSETPLRHRVDAIRSNRSGSAEMPLAQRDLADVLASIVAQRLTSQRQKE